MISPFYDTQQGGRDKPPATFVHGPWSNGMKHLRGMSEDRQLTGRGRKILNAVQDEQVRGRQGRDPHPLAYHIDGSR
jgi:hypothetical protein